MYYGASDSDPTPDVSYVNSFENSSSSSDKENVKPGRKRMLDDALFEFFSKEAIKSLKRDFANFCNESAMFCKNKRLKEHVISRDSFISYSIKYFYEVLKSLTVHQKEVIMNFGFGCLLLFEKCEIPSSFIRWIACCVDPVSHQIIVDDTKVISITKESVHYVIGLPKSGIVPMPDSDGGLKFLLSMFGLSELPHITFFGNKLKSKEVLTDKEIFVCFMVVAFKCFLFPTMDEYPNTDFLSTLQEPEYACRVDFSLLVFEHVISGVFKYTKACKSNGRKPKGFEFCYYFLAVYYLDSLDFGARMLEQSVPRISVWKGNLIKFFSGLDYKKKNLFGKRNLKKSLPPCYSEFGLQGVCKSSNDANDAPNICIQPSSFSMVFKNNLQVRFGSAIDSKIIDGIIDSVQTASFSKDDNVSKFEVCVTNVLEFLLELNSCSKVPSTEPNPFGVGIRNGESSKHEPSAYIKGNTNNNSEANTDVGSKFDMINQNDFSRALSSSDLGNKQSNFRGSPKCLINKAVDHCSLSTAPAMHPMKKVKSRLNQSVIEKQVLLSSNTYPAGLEDYKSLIHPDCSTTIKDHSIPFGCYVAGNNFTSPISKINLPQSTIEKDVSDFLTPQHGVVKNQGSVSNNLSGSKQAPIPVLEASPNPQFIHTSPEVQFVGPRNFSTRQSELAKKSDELYNNLASIGSFQDGQQSSSKNKSAHDQEYIDLSQNAAEGRLPKDNLVVLQCKNTLVLPLLQNCRFPVSDQEVKYFCAIVELAYTKGIQKTYSVMYTKVHCSYISLGQSLQREGHIDNFLIPVFCRKLFEDNHPSKSGRHHFFSFIGENMLEYKNDVQLGIIAKAFLGAASASKGKRLDLSDRLFFPICRTGHWFTFSVDFKYKIFIFLDSLYNKNDDFHTSIKNKLINNFVKLWKLVFNTEENIFKNFGVMYPNVPKQDNAHDCGVFTMKFMEIFKPELNMCKLFSKEDIIHIRIQYANQIYFCQRNKVDKSVVIDFKFEP